MKYDHHLYRYILHKQMTPSTFAETLGMKRPDRLYNVLQGKNGLSIKLANLITSIYNDVSFDWLMTGQGEMIELKGKDLGLPEVKEQSPKYGNQNVTAIANDQYMEVEFVDLSVSAGSLDRTTTRSRNKMLVPREYEKGEYMVVRVDGPSMDDGSIYSIPNGANILIRKLHLDNGDKIPIRDNIFVIDAKEGQALKQIIEHNTELGYIVCHSYNSEYKDYKIMMEDIIGIYIFRKIVSFRPPIRDIN